MENTARSVLFGQIALFAGLAICALLKPSGLSANDGISYYGIFRETILPYAAALLGATYFLERATSTLPPNEHRLRLAFVACIFLIVGIVVTPYAAGHWLNYLHTAFGSSLFSLQLVLSGWLTKRLRFVWWAIVLVTIELLAGILSAAYLNPTHGYLIQSQLLFQLVFGALLFLSLLSFGRTKTVPMPETSPAAHHSVQV